VSTGRQHGLQRGDCRGSRWRRWVVGSSGLDKCLLPLFMPCCACLLPAHAVLCVTALMHSINSVPLPACLLLPRRPCCVTSTCWMSPRQGMHACWHTMSAGQVVGWVVWGWWRVWLGLVLLGRAWLLARYVRRCVYVCAIDGGHWWAIVRSGVEWARVVWKGPAAALVAG